jgi:shikimate dehydrogenase
MTPMRAEVWGSPIRNSKSPQLHRACYDHLGVPGTYGSREVSEDGLADAFANNSDTLTGISLTMPLKTGILDLVPDHRGDVDMLEAANTAIKTDGQWWLANTDPLGAAAMLRRLLPAAHEDVVLLGAGATARSLVLGLAHVGLTGRLSIVVRSAERAARTMRLANDLGLSVEVVEFDALKHHAGASLVISTLPSGLEVAPAILDVLSALGGALMDVGYQPWPTPLAASFETRGVMAHSGLPMLLFQALGQIRGFVNGDIDKPLADEEGAVVAMAQAVGLDEVWATPSLMGQ